MCEKRPTRVWYKNEIWQVVGGCHCCTLDLYRMENGLEPNKEHPVHRTSVAAGLCKEYQPTFKWVDNKIVWEK